MPFMGQVITGAYGQTYYWNGSQWVQGSSWDAEQFLAHYQEQLERVISKNLTFSGGATVGYVPPATDPTTTSQEASALATATNQITRNSPAPRINPISPLFGIPWWIIIVAVLFLIFVLPRILKR